MCRLCSVVSLSYHSLQRGRNAFLLCAIKLNGDVVNQLRYITLSRFNEREEYEGYCMKDIYPLKLIPQQHPHSQ